MIAVGELDKLVVFNSVSLVDFTVGGVKTLHGKALLRVKEEVIDFFGYALGRHIILIVLMRWEACPVTLGAVSLSDS